MHASKRFDRAFFAILCVAVALGVFGIVHGCVRAAEKKQEVQTVYICYTDEQGSLYAKTTDPWANFEHADKVAPAFVLDASERQTVAEIVAGQSVGKSVTCQTLVANVLYNQIHANGDKLDGTDYAGCARKRPTADTYAAVDAIFQRGEWLLDDTVLWTGDAENPDAFHQSLRLVTTQEGIGFYEAE